MMRRLIAASASVLAVVLLTGAAVAPDAQADPVRAAEYWLDEYGIRDAWATTRGAGVRIAIIDTGVGRGPVEFEGAVAGETVERHGVRIVGHRNVPSRLAADASALYARNIYNFLSAFWDKEASRVVLPDDDEIVKGVRLTQSGKVVNERLNG